MPSAASTTSTTQPAPGLPVIERRPAQEWLGRPWASRPRRRTGFTSLPKPSVAAMPRRPRSVWRVAVVRYVRYWRRRRSRAFRPHPRHGRRLRCPPLLLPGLDGYLNEEDRRKREFQNRIAGVIQAHAAARAKSASLDRRSQMPTEDRHSFRRYPKTRRTCCCRPCVPRRF